VTPAVKELAERITKEKADAPAQAEALFKWVSQNIRWTERLRRSGLRYRRRVR
jgi:transglutaminase-like putative cysteine protease